MTTLKTIEFTDEEIDVICDIINNCGSGQHPWCSKTSYGGFYIKYLRQIIKGKKFDKAKINLTVRAKSLLETINTKIFLTTITFKV